MPLRDHFRSPVNDKHHRSQFHGGWPMKIVRTLFDILPPSYQAGPRLVPGSSFEVDVSVDDGGGTATLVAPAPTLTVAADLTEPDVYEVRVYDWTRDRRPRSRSSARRTRTGPTPGRSSSARSCLCSGRTCASRWSIWCVRTSSTCTPSCSAASAAPTRPSAPRRRPSTRSASAPASRPQAARPRAARARRLVPPDGGRGAAADGPPLADPRPVRRTPARAELPGDVPPAADRVTRRPSPGAAVPGFDAFPGPLAGGPVPWPAGRRPQSAETAPEFSQARSCRHGRHFCATLRRYDRPDLRPSSPVARRPPVRRRTRNP